MKKSSAAQLLLAIALVLPLTLTGCKMSVGGDGGEKSSDDSQTEEGVTPASDEKSGDDDDKSDRRRRGRRDKDKKEEKKEEAVPVEVAALSTGAIESVLRFSSNLEAEDQVTVVSEANRRIVELLVEEGDRVRRGQVLLRLQNEEQQSQLAKTESQLAKAQREYERNERLYKQKMISEEAFNNATYEVEQLELSLADAKRELSYTIVRAPIGGTVTQRMVNLGDTIQNGQNLFEIIDFDSLVARVYVPEKNLSDLSKGLTARIAPQAATGDYTGRIERISPVVDARSGTVKVTVDVGAQRGLRPGMYVDVDLVTATENEALLIPKRALVYDNDQMFVFRIDEGEERRVERIRIEARLTDKDNVWPIRGVDAGDRIVIAGQSGLKDGALVSLPGEKPKDAEAAEDKPADAVAETPADNASQSVIAEAKG